MFEPWFRAVDSAHGMWVGAMVGSSEIATAMARQGAKEGQEYAGPYGALGGGALGWAYGGLIGLFVGAAHGTMAGAKHYIAPPQSATVHHPKTSHPKT
jgi:hypothetical protein